MTRSRGLAANTPLRSRVRAAMLMLIALGAGTAPVRGAAPPAEFAYDFTLAKILADEGRTRQALQRLQRLVAVQPEDPTLRLEYAQLLRRSGDLAAALEEVDRALALAPEDPQVLAAVAELHSTQSGGNEASRRKARQALETLSRQAQPDPRMMGALAQLYLEDGESEKAVDVLVRLDELWPDQRSVHALLMESLLRAGRAGEARQRLGSWLERHPRELEARMTLAQMQQEAGDWSGAVATLRAAPAADRGNLELRRRLALALVHDTELDAARGELQDLVATGAGEPADRFLLAVFDEVLGNWEAAHETLGALLREDPDQEEWLLLQAEVLANLERPEAAVDLLDAASGRLRADDPESADRLEAASWDLMLRHDLWPQLRAAIEPRLASLPPERQGAALLSLVEAWRQTGAGERALDALQRNAPELPAALVEAERIRTLRGLGREAEAAAAVTRLEEGEGPRLEQAIRLRMIDEDYPGAVPLARRLLAQDGENVWALFWLASSTFETGDSEEAESLLRRLLDVNAEFAPALNFLGYLLADENRALEEALELTRAAVRQEPDNGAYVDSLGWTYFRLGNLEQAARHLDHAARLLPEDGTVREHVGDLARARGDLQAAREAYLRALELGPEDEAALREKLANLPERP